LRFAAEKQALRKTGTCFQLPAVLTMPTNLVPPSAVPAAPLAVTSTRSQSQTKR
jgi:hypothetical protein